MKHPHLKRSCLFSVLCTALSLAYCAQAAEKSVVIQGPLQTTYLSDDALTVEGDVLLDDLFGAPLKAHILTVQQLTTVANTQNPDNPMPGDIQALNGAQIIVDGDIQAAGNIRASGRNLDKKEASIISQHGNIMARQGISVYSFAQITAQEGGVQTQGALFLSGGQLSAMKDIDAHGNIGVTLGASLLSKQGEIRTAGTLSVASQSTVAAHALQASALDVKNGASVTTSATLSTTNSGPEGAGIMVSGGSVSAGALQVGKGGIQLLNNSIRGGTLSSTDTQALQNIQGDVLVEGQDSALSLVGQTTISGNLQARQEAHISIENQLSIGSLKAPVQISATEGAKIHLGSENNPILLKVYADLQALQPAGSSASKIQIWAAPGSTLVGNLHSDAENRISLHLNGSAQQPSSWTGSAVGEPILLYTNPYGTAHFSAGSSVLGYAEGQLAIEPNTNLNIQKSGNITITLNKPSAHDTPSPHARPSTNTPHPSTSPQVILRKVDGDIRLQPDHQGQYPIIYALSSKPLNLSILNAKGQPYSYATTGLTTQAKPTIKLLPNIEGGFTLRIISPTSSQQTAALSLIHILQGLLQSHLQRLSRPFDPLTHDMMGAKHVWGTAEVGHFWQHLNPVDYKTTFWGGEFGFSAPLHIQNLHLQTGGFLRVEGGVFGKPDDGTNFNSHMIKLGAFGAWQHGPYQAEMQLSYAHIKSRTQTSGLHLQITQQAFDLLAAAQARYPVPYGFYLVPHVLMALTMQPSSTFEGTEYQTQSIAHILNQEIPLSGQFKASSSLLSRLGLETTFPFALNHIAFKAYADLSLWHRFSTQQTIRAKDFSTFNQAKDFAMTSSSTWVETTVGINTALRSFCHLKLEGKWGFLSRTQKGYAVTLGLSYQL